MKSIIPIRAVANKWLSDNFNGERRYLSSGAPKFDKKKKYWKIEVLVKANKKDIVGVVGIDKNMDVVEYTNPNTIKTVLKKRVKSTLRIKLMKKTSSKQFGFFYGDGIKESSKLKDLSVDMLLTDPPYGISDPYTCEQQIPRRLRTNGSDFIMPKGEFGEWDHGFSPEAWTDVVMPKIKGWAIIFCAQAQIGQYSEIFKKHKFNAIGTLVWHKTNPVPFNHKFKPLNAWEAAVIGKRPGTKFHGKSVHNVFTYKSPSPQHRIHPTQKPLALMEKLIELCSTKNELVLDPFAGSATTVIAAQTLSRKCLAFENNKEHYSSASYRINNSLFPNF